MPTLPQDRPRGLGQKPTETWTINGAPLSDFFHGEVFTDGSCFKRGPPPWYQAGWSVVKISTEGVVLAWARGVLGTQLPQSSPAAENLAVLAAMTSSKRLSPVLSDYQGVAGLVARPPREVGHRKALYAGVRLLARSQAEGEVEVLKVKAHANPDAVDDPRDKYLAMGNQAAAEIAKSAALLQAGPSEGGFRQWEVQSAALRRFLMYIPRALALWPQVSPSSGRKPLPKKAAYSARRRSGVSFVSDVVGPLLVQPPPQAGARSSQEAEPSALEGRRGSSQGSYHHWRWQAGRWLCTSCLSTSRGGVPRRVHGCPGQAPHLWDLLAKPRGHKLQIATFAGGVGIVVICSKCGHYATSGRPCKLHKESCKGAFESPGARSAYERVCTGRHPRHARGESKLLDPCMSSEALLAAAAASAEA